MNGHRATPSTLGPADWLCLSAAPAFAAMALLTVGSGGPDMMCSAMPTSSPLAGMVPMYLLMSAFHLPPWLKLIARRRRGRIAVRVRPDSFSRSRSS